MRVQFVLSEIAIGLKRNLTMTIAVVLSTAVALGMLGAAFLMVFQVNTMKGYWYDKVEVTVSLCDQNDAARIPNCKSGAVTDQQRSLLQSQLGAETVVQTVFYETQQEAYQHYKDQFKDSPIKDVVGPNDLPSSLRVKLKNPNQSAVIIDGYSGRPGVAEVQDQRQFLSGIFKLINGLTVASIAVAGVGLILALMLIVNTVRLSAFSRRRETGIMRLVGASNFYIRLPFLMEGAIAGAIGAVGAGAGVALVKAVLIDKMLRPAFLNQSFVGWDKVILIVPLLVLLGIVMSSLASVLTLRKYLQV